MTNDEVARIYIEMLNMGYETFTLSEMTDEEMVALYWEIKESEMK